MVDVIRKDSRSMVLDEWINEGSSGKVNSPSLRSPKNPVSRMEMKIRSLKGRVAVFVGYDDNMSRKSTVGRAHFRAI